MTDSYLGLLCIATIFSILVCQDVHAQVPLANKPVMGHGSTASLLSPDEVPAGYPGGIRLSYLRSSQPAVPLREVQAVDAAGRDDVRQSTTFYDGLGRPLQTVERDAMMDVVSPVVYDNRGRETRRYLPFARTGNGGFSHDPFAEQQVFYGSVLQDANAEPAYPGELFYYGSTVYEASPLNRQEVALSPGNAWVGSDRGKRTGYGTNTVFDRLPVWSVAERPYPEEDMPVSVSFYPAGSLTRLSARDEDGKEVLEYRDQRGLAMVKQVVMGADRADWLTTYYVYDDMNRLRMMLPPKAVAEMKGTCTMTRDILEELCFVYQYDGMGRVIGKKSPAVGWQRMVYDRRDKLVFSQSASNQADGVWMATCYDALGRQVMTGLLQASTDRAALQSYVDRQAGGYSSINTDAPGDAVSVWMNACPPGYPFTSVTLTRYDDYLWTEKRFTDQFNQRLTPGSSRSAENLPAGNVQAVTATQGLVTGTLARVLGNAGSADGRWLRTVNFYDPRGRVIQVQSDNQVGGEDITTSRYDFEGHLVSEYLVHRYPGAEMPETRLLTEMDYDASGRLAAVFKTVNDEVSSRKMISRMTYNVLGRLAVKELGRSSAGQPLERQVYNYNLQGWLTGINGRTGSVHEFISGTELPWFSLSLDYDQPGSTGRYAGSVAAIRWQSRGDGVSRAYGFSYDRSARLLGADYSETGRNGLEYVDDAPLNFDMVMGNGKTAHSAYDANGNIQAMKQWGYKQGQVRLIDDLAYRYAAGSDKLLDVDDLSVDSSKGSDFYKTGHAGEGFTYDYDGRLTSDGNKGINRIVYNHLNLPVQILFGSKGEIEYVYDAMGRKLEKRVRDFSMNTEKRTIYIGGFTYTQSGNESPRLEMIAHEEGRIRPSNFSAERKYVFDYFLRDHLGSVRMVLTDEEQHHAYPIATLEAGSLDNEKKYYMIPDDASRVRREEVPGYPDNAGVANNEYIQRLQGTGSRTGTSILLRVLSGDRVSMRATSWYPARSVSPSGSAPIPEIIAGLLQSLAGTGAAKLLFTPSGSTGLIAPALARFLENQHGDGPATGKPAAYLNWLLLDEQLNPVTTNDGRNSGYDLVGEAGELKHHQVIGRAVTRNGYLYIYVSNRSDDMPVYFDDLQVTHTPGPLLEETHYYPFGGTIDAISSRAMGMTGNRSGYNGKEKQGREFADGNGLDWYDYGARMYDPTIGRWFVPDPLGERYVETSPYAYAFNDPLRYVDPDGKAPSDIIVLNAPKNVGGLGHAAVLIGNDKNGYYLYSKNGTEPFRSSGYSNMRESGIFYESLFAFANSRTNFDIKTGLAIYTRAYRIKTDEKQDVKMNEAAKYQVESWYDVVGVFGGRCIDVCSDALKAGGLNPGSGSGYANKDILNSNFIGQIETAISSIPNERYFNIVKLNKGIDATSALLTTAQTRTKYLNDAIYRMQVAKNKKWDDVKYGPINER